MSGICVEYWQDTESVASRIICIICLTARLFKCFLNWHSHRLWVTVVTQLCRRFQCCLHGKGERKAVELDADVSMSVSFGCRYVWFNLPVASSLEPVAKRPCHSWAFDVLLANVAMGNKLPAMPNLFLPQTFIPTDPNFLRQSSRNTKYFWSGLNILHGFPHHLQS